MTSNNMQIVQIVAMLIMIRSVTVTLIRTVVLQRSWYQMPGCSVQWKMNKNTHGYMAVWYTKGIYVSFVNCFEVILPHHTNLLLLALTLVRTVWLLFHYWTYKLINVLLSPSFPNSHHLRTNFPNYKGPETQIQMGKKITVKYSGVVNFSSQMSYMSTGNAHLLPSY